MKKKQMSKLATEKRVQKMRKLRDEYLKIVDQLHVKLQPGNTKTGMSCWTVSTLPVIDCINCKHCMYECYDLRNDCRFENVIKDRARNSAIHLTDPERFWREVEEQIDLLGVPFLRINVGGDLRYDDFTAVNDIAKRNRGCRLLFFTKNYEELNAWLDDNGNFVSNVSDIWSRWEDLPSGNRHNVPEAHVLYEDGRTTAPEYGAYFCQGNCSRCGIKVEGCWALKKGESVVFKNH